VLVVIEVLQALHYQKAQALLQQLVALMEVQVFITPALQVVDEVVTGTQVILVAGVQEVVVADETALLVQAFLEKEILAHLVRITDLHFS
jgi:hypothetical protein